MVKCGVRAKPLELEEEAAVETEQKLRNLMAFSKESEIYVVSQVRKVKWSDGRMREMGAFWKCCVY